MTADINESSKPTRLISSVRELITLLGASAGLFAGLFYLAGRSYASGYFGAMNIPEYMISLSLQDYASSSWLPMFVYPAMMIAIGGLMWGVVYAARDFVSPYFKKKFTKLPKINLPGIGSQARLMFTLFGIGVFSLGSIWFVTTCLSVVERIGALNGKKALLEQSMPTDLIADKPIMAEPIEVISGAEGTYYVYSGFRLLQVNNGKYYLFKEIDPDTCKPRLVYIVDAAQFRQINLSPATSLKELCN